VEEAPFSLETRLSNWTERIPIMGDFHSGESPEAI
jgi:hypothetical protein